jgi:hypothetical protein
MNYGRAVRKAIPLLIAIGLSLSGCVAEPVGYYDGYAYGPLYGSFDVGHGGRHDGWDHDHGEHGGWGHGVAHGGFGGHAGVGHGGGEHGGGGHGGGGHR